MMPSGHYSQPTTVAAFVRWVGLTQISFGDNWVAFPLFVGILFALSTYSPSYQALSVGSLSTEINMRDRACR